MNDGSGNFTDSGQSLGNSSSSTIALGDLDGDGDLDAFVANTYNSFTNADAEPNKVWVNNGDGTFTDSGQLLGGNAYSEDVSLADLDGDGDLDAYIANSINQTNKLWLNDGSGNFTDSGQSLGNSSSYGISLDDLDADGDIDAFVVNHFVSSKVWLNNGNGDLQIVVNR